MPIFDLFSKRQKRLRGEVPDVYQYRFLPDNLRVQIVHILRDGIGVGHVAGEVYEFIHDRLCREYGKFTLIEAERSSYETQVLNFILHAEDTEQLLDAIELSFKAMAAIRKERGAVYTVAAETKMNPRDAVQELNERFRQHGVGYQFESGEIVRVDSQLLHASAVKPALHLLLDKPYSGANEEFLGAHEHYRHGRHKECLVECLKAFESTLKAICDQRSWQYKTDDTAKKLIQVCFQNSLIPPFLEAQYSSLRQNLESGVPTVRNKLGGHGQGSTPKLVPAHFAAYQLHMTATAILFLIEAEKQLP